VIQSDINEDICKGTAAYAHLAINGGVASMMGRCESIQAVAQEFAARTYLLNPRLRCLAYVQSEAQMMVQINKHNDNNDKVNRTGGMAGSQVGIGLFFTVDARLMSNGGGEGPVASPMGNLLHSGAIWVGTPRDGITGAIAAVQHGLCHISVVPAADVLPMTSDVFTIAISPLRIIARHVTDAVLALDVLLPLSDGTSMHAYVRATEKSNMFPPGAVDFISASHPQGVKPFIVEQCERFLKRQGLYGLNLSRSQPVPPACGGIHDSTDDGDTLVHPLPLHASGRIVYEPLLSGADPRVDRTERQLSEELHNIPCSATFPFGWTTVDGAFSPLLMKLSVNACAGGRAAYWQIIATAHSIEGEF
jgi:hypothetical protein